MVVCTQLISMRLCSCQPVYICTLMKCLLQIRKFWKRNGWKSFPLDESKERKGNKYIYVQYYLCTWREIGMGRWGGAKEKDDLDSVEMGLKQNKYRNPHERVNNWSTTSIVSRKFQQLLVAIDIDVVVAAAAAVIIMVYLLLLWWWVSRWQRPISRLFGMIMKRRSIHTVVGASAAPPLPTTVTTTTFAAIATDIRINIASAKAHRTIHWMGKREEKNKPNRLHA